MNDFSVLNIRETTDIALLASFLGLFLPYLIALINNPRWSPQVRGLVAMVIYGITGVAVAWWQGQIDHAPDLVAAIVPIFLVSMTKYHFLDKPSLLAPRIEYFTSRRSFDNYAIDHLAKDPKAVEVTTPKGEEHLYKPEM